MARRALAVAVGIAALLAVAVLVVQPSLWVGLVGVGEYDEREVTVYEGDTETATPAPTTTTESVTTVAARDEDGERLATVTVRIADTATKRYVGLSRTESLEPDEGMLFVHEEEGEYAYVMREMAFPLDILFVDANGTITTVHHASLPPAGTEESDLTRYEGRGKYVLEVNRGWANRTGVGVGDRVVLPEELR